MKYFILAGEASGDLHASNLIKNINKFDSDAEFVCWGGDKMQQQGGKILKHINELAFMGFIEVAKNIRKILGNFKLCHQHIKEFNPDTLILVDYPGFNLRIARKAKKMGYKVVYYISPTVWAWKESRVETIKKYVDKMFVILPFEQDFYKKHDYKVEFEGHPLMDSIGEWKNQNENSEKIIEEYKLDKRKIVALLPGSRKQELDKILPIMLRMPSEFQNYQFVIAGTSSLDKSEYSKFAGFENTKIIFDKTYDILSVADAAIVTSGTATLETALLNVPEIVCYKTSGFSYAIAKLLVHIRFISLVNLIMNKEVVKELIQNDLDSENLKTELDKILNNNEKREKMFNNFAGLQEKLSGTGVSERIARKIVNCLKFKKC